MKALYDTCLYIDLLRSGKRLELFQDRHQIRYLSPIVLMELRAGAQSPRQIRAIEQLIYPYLKASRAVLLEERDYFRAGECLARLAKRQSIGRGLSDDVLIALSAVRVGATLYTSNRKDFEPIGRSVAVRIEYVS